MTATTVSSRTTPRVNRPSVPAWPSRLVNRHPAVRSGGGKERGRMLERGPSLWPSARGPKHGQPASSAVISSPAGSQSSTARPVGVSFSTNRPALIPELGTRAGLSFCIPKRWRLLDLAGDGYLSDFQSLDQKLVFFAAAFFWAAARRAACCWLAAAAAAGDADVLAAGVAAVVGVTVVVLAAVVVGVTVAVLAAAGDADAVAAGVAVVVGVVVVVLAAAVVLLAVVVLAVLVLAVVAGVVEVVGVTGVKVPAGTRLFGKVEDALCAFASW